MAKTGRARRGPASATTLRIIGGAWRGRRLAVPAAPGLRPTPQRVRETLFNWLAPHIAGAVCVDAFAGTGALGLEALSRGAAHVAFVDTNAVAIARLRAALDTLGGGRRATVTRADIHRTALRVARADIVFVDPPFAAGGHAAALACVAPLLTPEARVYLEYPADQYPAIEAALDHDYRILRAKRAAAVGYCLARAAPGGEHSAP